MRSIVYGLGAVGGVLAAQLHRAGHDVVAIARGEQLEAVRRHGLRLLTPELDEVVPLTAVGHPGEIDLKSGDVVLLAMKSHHTEQALHDLADVAPDELPVVSLQNGVANEPRALRHFAHVYGVYVLCPTTFLEPGVVLAHSAPSLGVLDVGRYPSGSDELATQMASVFQSAGFESDAVEDIQRWKYAKLLDNLSNALEAVCGPEMRDHRISELVRREGTDCLDAAGIDYGARDPAVAARRQHLRIRPIGGERRGGGSSWQSLSRKAGTVETDYLNGEIALLGRLHGISTPLNSALQRIANQMARSAATPGSVSPDQLLAGLSAEGKPRR